MSEERDLPSELALEQLALDEAPRELVEQLGPRLVDGDVRAHLDALREDDAAILAAYPPARALAIVRARAAAKKASASRTIPWLVAIPVVVAVGALFVLVLRTPDIAPSHAPEDAIADASDIRLVPHDVVPFDRPSTDVRPHDVRPQHPEVGPEDGIRIKGQEAHLVIHRREADGPMRLDADAVVHSRDLLQLGYVAAGDAHGVIVSIDGAGAVTLHFPDAVDGSSALEQGEVVALAHSYELDDAPSFERFVFVTAKTPIDPATVVQAAELLADTPKRARAKRLALPSRWKQSSLLLRKAEP